VALWVVEAISSIGAGFAPAGTTAAFPIAVGESLLVLSDEMAVLWDLDTTLWVEATCRAAGRNLTETEWAKYFPGRDYQITCPQWAPRPKL
jgi:hypothetical protein